MDKKNVRIRLFKDNSRYKGDLFVSVNGVSYKIRRGVEVEVPPEVAEVLEHSQMQDELTAARATHIAHDVEGNTVVDHVHQPLRDSRAGYCARHGNGQLAHAAKVYLAGADNMVYRLAGDDRGQQGSDHCDQRKCQRQDDHAGVGADQLQNAMDGVLVQFLFLLAHSVLATSSLLSWLRQISL